LNLSIDGGEEWGAVGHGDVGFSGAAIFADVLAFGFPADGSGGFVECDDELDIGAIAIEDEEILEEYG
jgi:hypothetical protein